jgi:hypothetical protein
MPWTHVYCTSQVELNFRFGLFMQNYGPTVGFTFDNVFLSFVKNANPISDLLISSVGISIFNR